MHNKHMFFFKLFFGTLQTETMPSELIQLKLSPILTCMTFSMWKTKSMKSFCQNITEKFVGTLNKTIDNDVVWFQTKCLTYTFIVLSVNQPI